MVAEISGAGQSHSVVSQLGSTVSQRVVESVRLAALGKETGAVVNDETQSSSTQVAGLYAKLLSRQDSLGRAASMVREVVATIEKADQLLSKMEEKLGAVVKMYPPYLVENPERVSLLNSFGGLRRQIDALTLPPPEKLDALGRLIKTQEDAAKSPEKPAQVSAVSLARVPLWDVPALDPLSSGDAEVRKALDQVNSARSVLGDLQSGIWKDVNIFVQQADFPEVQSRASGTREQLSSSLVYGVPGIGGNASQLALAVEMK